MKKAKEYAAEFKANPTDEHLVTIVRAFMLEVKEIAEMRHARSNESFISIFDEQDRKWKAFARAVGGNIIRLEGFEQSVKAYFPTIHAFWRGPLRKHL